MIRDVVEELGEGLRGVDAEVVKLVDKLLDALLLDHVGAQRGRLVRKEVLVVRLCELELEVCGRGVQGERAGAGRGGASAQWAAPVRRVPCSTYRRGCRTGRGWCSRSGPRF